MARMTVGKILYGAAFTVVLPVLLILWAAGAEPSVALPAFGDPAFGFVLALCGLGLTAAGMRGLWRFGGGLPMNAFPPPKLVSRGAFRWIPHPIYTGFVAACLGVSMAARSAAGLWLVTPVVALGCAALVLGYERPDMLRRFGAILRVLPADEEKPPAATDRARFFFAAVVPWIAFYEYAAHLAPGSPWAGAVYWSLWLAAAASTWFARTRRGLRRLMVSVWVAAAVTLPFCWLARAPFPPLWAAAAALVAAPALLRPEFFWERLRRAAERLANSWREWRIGPVRIINHGLYAGAGAFVHVAVVIAAVGPERKWDALATAFAGLIGAAA
ncbi:MAG: phosphatidylethanolamine N-methyltransferase family protein, partial [Acidobacteriia bacterium]|nr:phosphatidylethanolamine N-methyltransferase family protein [Terriglobia bacterium]